MTIILVFVHKSTEKANAHGFPDRSDRDRRRTVTIMANITSLTHRPTYQPQDVLNISLTTASHNVIIISFADNIKKTSLTTA